MTTRYATPAALNCDAYKAGHMAQYPAGLSYIMQNLTARSSKFFNSPLKIDGVIAAGIQRFCSDYLHDHWNETFFQRHKQEVVDETVELINGIVFGSPVKRENIEALHDLGYLPVEVFALPEGTLCPIKVPMVVFRNTHKDFAWVAGYLEDAFSNELWKITTIATTAFHYKRILQKWSAATCDNDGHVMFQGHDFSLRGMSGMNDGAFNAVGHLFSFLGTDGFPAVYQAKRVYGDGMTYGEIGSTVAATEHTVMCANISKEVWKNKSQYNEFGDEELQKYDGEVATFKRLLTEVYPTGIVSVVSDTYNYWRTLDCLLEDLKDVIEGRDGKLVIRPDSGTPFFVVCGYKTIHFEDAKEWLIEHLGLNPKYHGEMNLAYAKAAMTMEQLPCKDLLRKAGYELIIGEEDEYGAEVYDLLAENATTMTHAEIRGSVQTLWDIFGGSVNEKGYKVLAPCIGLIYGDSITMSLADSILKRLAENGFAASNVVFGIGSYTYQYMTRDTFGFAVKATACLDEAAGFLELSKDPITDRGLKKSAKGCTQVMEVNGETTLIDGLAMSEFDQLLNKPSCMLRPYFCNSQLWPESFDNLKTIRERVDSQL